MSGGSHVFADTTTLDIQAFASWLARRPASSTHSFGLQGAEVLGAMFNTMLTLALVVAPALAALVEVGKVIGLVIGFAASRAFVRRTVPGHTHDITAQKQVGGQPLSSGQQLWCNQLQLNPIVA